MQFNSTQRHNLHNLTLGDYKSNQTNFQEISRRHFNKTLTLEITLILLPAGFHLILANNYWAAMLIPNTSDPVYQVDVTIMRNTHNHHQHLPHNWAGANFLWLDVSVLVPSVKNFQDQWNSRLFPVFPGGILKSRSCRHPVTPEWRQNNIKIKMK